MDFDAMSDAYHRSKSGKTYQELQEENESLRKELASSQSTMDRMAIVLQDSVEAVLRLARERKAEGTVISE